MIREKRTVNCWLLTNKGNCEGKPTKPLQLPFILPIELITAFLNFQKLISSGSANKQNYMMHTDHSWSFIDLFWCITSLSEVYLFRNPTAIKQKKEHPAPNCGSPFGFLFVQKLLSNAETFISNSNLNAGILIPNSNERWDSHPNLTIFSKPMTTAPFAWFPLREPSWLSLSEVVLDCTNLSCNSYQYCENHT